MPNGGVAADRTEPADPAAAELPEGAPAQAAGRYAHASPITHVSRHAAPTLLIHGTADHQVPLRQSELPEQKMRKAGVGVTLLRLKDAGHNFAGDFEEEANRALFRFLGRHLENRCEHCPLTRK